MQMFGMLVALLGGAKALIAGKAAVLLVAVVSSGAVVAAVVAAHQAEFPADPLTVIEQPKLGQAIDGTFEVTGFSIDRNTEAGTGVSKVILYLDAVDEEHKLGEATLGLESEEALAYREDEDDERFEGAGWTFTWPEPRLQGNRVLYVVAWSGHEPLRSSTTALEVNDPLVEITEPEAGDDVSGELVIRGWALDRYSPDATPTAHQIDRVEIYLGDELQGTAELGLPSPGDVLERYGVADAGWRFTLDLGGLEPGEHTLRAVAHSAVQDSANEVRVLVIVFDPPEPPGDGCGWLVGRAKGDAIQALQAGWQHFHGATQAYMSRMSAVDREDRASLRDTVHGTRDALHERRQEAHRELQALAKEYLALCLAGGSPDELAVTVEQEVVPVEHLLFGYRPIVDRAIEDMEQIFEAALEAVETSSDEASEETAERGRSRGPRGRP